MQSPLGMTGYDKGSPLVVVLQKIIKGCLDIAVGNAQGSFFIVQIGGQESRVVGLAIARRIDFACPIKSRSLVQGRQSVNFSVQAMIAQILVPTVNAAGFGGIQSRMHIEYIHRGAVLGIAQTGRCAVGPIPATGQGGPIPLVVIVRSRRNGALLKASWDAVKLPFGLLGLRDRP